MLLGLKTFSRFCFLLYPFPINLCICGLVMREEPLHCCRNPFQGRSQMKNMHKRKTWIASLHNREKSLHFWTRFAQFLTMKEVQMHPCPSLHQLPQNDGAYLRLDGKRESSYSPLWLKSEISKRSFGKKCYRALKQ